MSYVLFVLQRLLEKYDHDNDGHVYFEDFVRYVLEHERALRLSFESLDHNKDGIYVALL